MRALAGGTHGFYVEASYNFTHLSMRGLLTWDLQPQPDGRFEAVREIAAQSQKLAEFIRDAKIATPEETAAAGVSFTQPSKRLHLRIRTLPAGDCFALLINEDLDKPAAARLTVNEGLAYQVTDVLAGTDCGRLDASHKMSVTAPAGGAVCLKLKRSR